MRTPNDDLKHRKSANIDSKGNYTIPTAPLKKKDYGRIFFVWIVGIVAIALLSYPLAMTYTNSARQNDIAEKYDVIAEQEALKKDTTLAEELERAKVWQDTHQDKISTHDPWSKDVENSPQYKGYLDILNLVPANLDGEENSVMSVVTIPSIGVKMPVYHGTSDATLSEALGHLFGTALPIGEKGGRSVITGHTGMKDRLVFDRLTDMRKGDEFFVTTYGKKMRYVVNDIKVIEPDQVQHIEPVEGKDLVTLLTCTPYGVNSHRLLVTGQRAPLKEDSGENHLSSPAPWWMWALLACAVILLIYLIVWTYKEVNYRRRLNGKHAMEAQKANSLSDVVRDGSTVVIVDGKEYNNN